MGPENQEHLIIVRDLTKHYEMGDNVVRALRGVSFDITRGSFVAIMGPSGSGKTTLMDILGCLSRPTSGEYILNGTPVAALPENRLAELRNREIGFVFQNFNLLPRATALNNVELPLLYDGIGRRERIRRAEEALVAVGLGDRLDHRPSEMSGGQRQRVAIARALLMDPRILILDDSLSSVDTQTEKLIQSALDVLMEGRTTFVIAHRLSTVRRADMILVMDKGQIVEHGTHDELLARGGLYKEIHDLQLMQRDGFEEAMIESILTEKPQHENTIIAGRSNSG